MHSDFSSSSLPPASFSLLPPSSYIDQGLQAEQTEADVAKKAERERQYASSPSQHATTHSRKELRRLASKFSTQVDAVTLSLGGEGVQNTLQHSAEVFGRLNASREGDTLAHSAFRATYHSSSSQLDHLSQMIGSLKAPPSFTSTSPSQPSTSEIMMSYHTALVRENVEQVAGLAAMVSGTNEAVDFLIGGTVKSVCSLHPTLQAGCNKTAEVTTKSFQVVQEKAQEYWNASETLKNFSTKVEEQKEKSSRVLGKSLKEQGFTPSEVEAHKKNVKKLGSEAPDIALNFLGFGFFRRADKAAKAVTEAEKAFAARVQSLCDTQNVRELSAMSKARVLAVKMREFNVTFP